MNKRLGNKCLSMGLSNSQACKLCAYHVSPVYSRSSLLSKERGRVARKGFLTISPRLNVVL